MKAGRITSFSSIDDRFDYSRKGVYRGMIRNENAITMTVAVLTAFLWLSMLIYMIGTKITFFNIFSAPVLEFVIYAGLIALPFIAIGIIRTVRSGEEYSFTADNTKMLIVCPRKNFRADIFFEDVKNVEYKDVMFFGKLRGYNVTAVCGSGKYLFTYLFPYRSYRKDRDMTPFRIIEERAGLIEKPDFVAGRRTDL